MRTRWNWKTAVAAELFPVSSFRKTFYWNHFLFWNSFLSKTLGDRPESLKRGVIRPTNPNNRIAATDVTLPTRPNRLFQITEQTRANRSAQSALSNPTQPDQRDASYPIVLSLPTKPDEPTDRPNRFTQPDWPDPSATTRMNQLNYHKRMTDSTWSDHTDPADRLNRAHWPARGIWPYVAWLKRLADTTHQ